MHRVIVVDDEPKARQNIINALKLHKDFIILAEADSCDDAFKKILTEKPDVLFLDINMPQEDGFELLALLAKLGIENLTVIFLTAYDEYAIKAIKQGVFDYLLKPVDPEELKKTLDRYRSKKTNPFGEGVMQLKEYLSLGNKIKFNTNKGYIYLLSSDIIYIQADGSYSRVFESDNNFCHVSKNLKEIEEQLVHGGFLRVHKSYLINKQYLTSYDKLNRYCTLVKNGLTINIPVSFRFTKNISF